jgi:hypothetical protein
MIIVEYAEDRCSLETAYISPDVDVPASNVVESADTMRVSA